MTPTKEKKVCATCQVEKPVTEFGINKHYKDNLNIYCKKCRKAEYDRTSKSPAKVAEELAIKARSDLICRTVDEAGTLTADQILERLSGSLISKAHVGHCVRKGFLVGHKSGNLAKNRQPILTYTVSGIEHPEVKQEEARISLWSLWPVSVPKTQNKPIKVRFDDYGIAHTHY